MKKAVGIATVVIAVAAIVQALSAYVSMGIQEQMVVAASEANKISDAARRVLEAQLYPSISWQLLPEQLNITNNGLYEVKLLKLRFYAPGGSDMLSLTKEVWIPARASSRREFHPAEREQLIQNQGKEMRLEATVSTQGIDQAIKKQVRFRYDTIKKSWVSLAG